MLVRYFDLGAHKGGEVERMLDILDREPLATQWELYAFEAHPALARQCQRRFRKDRTVHVIQTALAAKEGTCTLFLNKNLVGSSIYEGKNNIIRGREVTVPCLRFSKWLTEALPGAWQDSFNIIKSNIEGAEWDIWHDLSEHRLLSAFDLWLGADEGHGGWGEDLRKIRGMEPRADELAAAFEKANIKVYRFSAFDKKIPNSDVPVLLHHRLTEYTRSYVA